MKTDANEDREYRDGHPTISVLTENEAALYASLVEIFAEEAEKISEYKQKHGEVDLEADELSDTVETIRRATLITELIDEVAVWRRCGVDQPENLQDTTWSTRGTAFLERMEGTDE